MRKFLMVAIIIVCMLLSGCHSSNKKLGDKMIDKYCEDNNYVSLSGEVVKFENNVILIECKELKNYIEYEDDLCDFYIYSSQPLELSIGEKVDFKTVPFHFFNGHELPIVELVVNGNTLLEFEEGKYNLIDWVKKSFTITREI